MNRTIAVAIALLALCSGCLFGSGAPGASTDSPGASTAGTPTPSPVEAPTSSPAGTPTATTSPSPTASPSPTPTTRPPSPTAVITPATVEFGSSGTACNEELSLHFWGLVPNENHWESNVARTYYWIPANASFHLVTYVDGVRSGVRYLNNSDERSIHVDGGRHELDASFSGRHVVRVVAYADENGNGQFEHGTDAPCLVDGDVVQAGPEVVNFSQYSD